MRSFGRLESTFDDPSKKYRHELEKYIENYVFSQVYIFLQNVLLDT